MIQSPGTPRSFPDAAPAVFRSAAAGRAAIAAPAAAVPATASATFDPNRPGGTGASG